MEQPNTAAFYDSEFATSSFAEFEDMRRKDVLIDCRIAVKNRCAKAHRLVLAARIPLFRKLLTTSAMGIIKIEEEIDPDILEFVIDFAYTGFVEITADNVTCLLSVSGYLQMNNVYEACWKFLERRLCPDNVWQTRLLADSCLRLTLVKVCNDYITENFESFSHSKDFLRVPFSYLKEAFSKGTVKISSEESKYEAIIRWTEISPWERKELLPDLLQTVCVSHLMPEYLIERISKEHLVQTSSDGRKWLDEAKNYHLLTFLKQKSECNSLAPPPERSPLPSFEFGIYAVCNSEFKSFVKFLDSKKKKWVTLSQRSLPRFVYYVFAVERRIYIFCKCSTEILDVKTLEWQSLKINHGNLHSAALVIINDVIYSFGGKGHLSLQVRCFNLRQNEWLDESQMKKPRMFSGVTALNENIYVTGGTLNISQNYDFKVESVYNDVERYDTQTKAWRKIPPMMYSRYDHGCTSLNAKIYVCGGFNSTYLNTAEMYDPSTQKWSSISPMSVGNRLYSVISHNGKLYTLGKCQQNITQKTAIHSYEPELNKWVSDVSVFEHCDCNDCNAAFLVCAATPEENNVTDTDESLHFKSEDAAVSLSRKKFRCFSTVRPARKISLGNSKELLKSQK